MSNDDSKIFNIRRDYYGLPNAFGSTWVKQEFISPFQNTITNEKDTEDITLEGSGQIIKCKKIFIYTHGFTDDTQFVSKNNKFTKSKVDKNNKETVKFEPGNFVLHYWFDESGKIKIPIKCKGFSCHRQWEFGEICQESVLKFD